MELYLQYLSSQFLSLLGSHLHLLSITLHTLLQLSSAVLLEFRLNDGRTAQLFSFCKCLNLLLVLIDVLFYGLKTNILVEDVFIMSDFVVFMLTVGSFHLFTHAN